VVLYGNKGSAQPPAAPYKLKPFKDQAVSFEVNRDNPSSGGSVRLEGSAGTRAEVDPRFGLMI